MINDDPEARKFCNDIMRRYAFTSEAIRRVNENFKFQIKDWSNTTGGGLCFYTEGGSELGTNLILLWGVQHEAAVHECAHGDFYIQWQEDYKGSSARLDWFQDGFADIVFHPEKYTEFKEIVALYHGYYYGIGDWPGMFGPRTPDGNWIEIHGGTCSFAMGKVELIPEIMWKPEGRHSTVKATLLALTLNEPIDSGSTDHTIYVPVLL